MLGAPLTRPFIRYYFFVGSFKHPRDRVCYFLFAHICVGCLYAPSDQMKMNQTWNLVHKLSDSDHNYLKTVFFFEKVTLSGASLEKLQCLVEFSHISSTALFIFYLFYLITTNYEQLITLLGFKPLSISLKTLVLIKSYDLIYKTTLILISIWPISTWHPIKLLCA